MKCINYNRKLKNFEILLHVPTLQNSHSSAIKLAPGEDVFGHLKEGGCPQNFKKGIFAQKLEKMPKNCQCLVKNLPKNYLNFECSSALPYLS